MQPYRRGLSPIVYPSSSSLSKQQSTTSSICFTCKNQASHILKPHLAATAAYLQGGEHSSLLRVSVIESFMEGHKRVIPLGVPPAPLWNLNIVITRRVGLPFEPLHLCPLQFISWKVSFLLAFSSLRCVCEFQTLSLQEPFFQVHTDIVALRTNPKFLPKVVYSFHPIRLSIS